MRIVEGGFRATTRRTGWRARRRRERRSIIAPPPVITAQPVNTTLLIGRATNFTVAATGTGTWCIQWFYNGTAVQGAIGRGVELDNVQ